MENLRLIFIAFLTDSLFQKYMYSDPYFGHSSKYSAIARPRTNFNTIAWFGTKYVSRESVYQCSLCPRCEKSKDKEWYLSLGTSSDGRGDLFEQSCLGVGNSKTRTLRQQLTIIYCLKPRLHTITREREREREREGERQRETERVSKGLRTDTSDTPPPAWPNSLNADF